MSTTADEQRELCDVADLVEIIAGIHEENAKSTGYSTPTYIGRRQAELPSEKILINGLGRRVL